MSAFYQHDPSLPLNQQLFAPLHAATARAKSHRRCRSLPDEEWIQIGVRRVLATETSGRGFLTLLEDRHDRSVAVSLFFASLRSSRRGTFAREVGSDVWKQTRDLCSDNDPFSDVSSLQGYDIYAGDGHFIEHACHDRPVDDVLVPTGGFFAVDLRSHALRCLTLAGEGTAKKREHDMRAIKRVGPTAMRAGAPVGRKVIWVWDRAGIDAAYWQQVKTRNGVYFVSRAKENMDLTKLGDLEYDRSDPLNDGVTGFHLISVASQALRCVHYRCPRTGAELKFITTLTRVEPGVIAALYMARWDIEKVFDETKRKLRESKSWASSEAAKVIHAELICLAHNLLLILERRLDREHGITNRPEEERRRERWNRATVSAEQNIRKASPLVHRLALRISQRTLVFIRWVRNNLDERRRWEDLLSRLARRYKVC